MAEIDAELLSLSSAFDTSGTDAEVLGHPRSPEDALASWCEWIGCEPHDFKVDEALTVAVSFGDNAKYTNDFYDTADAYHRALLTGLGKQTLAVKRLVFIARTFFPSVKSIIVIAWCSCIYRFKEDESGIHQAGSLRFDLDDDPFDDSKMAVTIAPP